MSLSICLLTRNAEHTVQRPIDSVAGLGAEIIVVDTGSTDDTVQAARARGAKAHVIDWHDDFGAVQNNALAQASGDWILWLNPDEELLPQGREQLAALMARPEALAYVVQVQEVMKPDQTAGATEIVFPRLFRKHPDVQFIGRIHPHFDPPLEELARRHNKKIYLSSLVVRHHAYVSTLTPDKLRWATRLLELELTDRPGQIHYIIEYGRNLLLLNDPKGHAILAEASERVLALGDAHSAPAPNVASLLEYLLSVSAEQSRSRITRSQAGELALRWFPVSPPLLWQLAQSAFQADDFRAAAELLEKLVQLGRTGTYDHSAAFDPSIMRESAMLNLAGCYVRLGDLDRAELWFGQVLTSPTHQKQARTGYQLVQDMRKRLRPKDGPDH
jgi:tetratricopeptide (TPR) repeat protein